MEEIKNKVKTVDEENKSPEKAKPMTLFEKAKELGAKCGEYVAKGIHVTADNIGWAMPVGIFIYSVGSGLFNYWAHKGETYTEDPQIGERLLIDHPLNNQESLELSQKMREEGVTKAEALNDMGLLKYEKKRRK